MLTAAFCPQRYNEAAQHILDALALQESDSVRDSDGTENLRGITSTALWDSLKTCSLHLGRHSLRNLLLLWAVVEDDRAVLCARRDTVRYDSR